MSVPGKRPLSLGSWILVLGGVALVALLFWGWKTGKELPLWPALLVAAVNIVGALKLLQETRSRQTRRPAGAAAAPKRARTGD